MGLERLRAEIRDFFRIIECKEVFLMGLVYRRAIQTLMPEREIIFPIYAG